MDNMKNTAPAGEQARDDDLILKLAKPYTFEGEEHTEVDLHGLENVSGGDLASVARMVAKLGVVSPMPEMTMDYCYFMAARVTGKKVEFFQGLPGREAIKLKNIVTGFLYGGDGDN